MPATNPKYTQLKLKPQYRERLQKLADRDRRSMASLVEILIDREMADQTLVRTDLHPGVCVYCGDPQMVKVWRETGELVCHDCRESLFDQEWE